MKLRNKETGEITEDIWYEYTEENIHIKGETKVYEYNSLAELNVEWEDYGEIKEYYYISVGGDISHTEDYDWESDRFRKEIGNVFKTKEEAEKAVEKLKAWARLKDKGFKFNGKTYETDKRFGSVFYEVDKDTYSEDIIQDLNLLFGGEDE